MSRDIHEPCGYVAGSLGCDAQCNPAPAGKYPDGNPKTAQGAKKIPLHLVPPSAVHYLAMAFLDGAIKYGPYNWRDDAVSATVYLAALKRHADAWFDGEDVATDSLVHHLAHAMACCAILLDAASVGKLIDDRPTPGAAARLQAEFAAAMALRNIAMDPPALPVDDEASEGIVAMPTPVDDHFAGFAVIVDPALPPGAVAIVDPTRSGYVPRAQA